MKIDIQITGLKEIQAKLGAQGKQAAYAASRALNTTAFAINTRLKADMARTFKGGATAYTLRAFEVKKATKADLTAEVALRTDAPSGGIAYSKALAHLFTGGTRKYKKVEGWLRARKLLPSGLTIAPGRGMHLDKYGNMDKRQLNEILAMLIRRPSKMRTYRKTGAGKATKAVDYFVVSPGDRSKLHPGIYKRVETGNVSGFGVSSGIDDMILYVDPVNYRKFIDLDKLGREVVAQKFQPAFDTELARALANAK